MNFFETQMFNQSYVSVSYYHQMQINNYFADQDERVIKAVHSFCDMLDMVESMDEMHQQQAFWMCLTEMAKRKGW